MTTEAKTDPRVAMGVFWTLIGIGWLVVLIALFTDRTVARTPVWEPTDG
jgi:hypothetical protein